MTIHQIREKYLKFFEGKQHVIVESASLLPENDPTTLFTSAGMQPMVPYLLGELHPKGKRLADSQKCFRAKDIEEVADNRHFTFFEMLGNWSFGDYFKTEQISWVFEFLIKEIGLDPNRIYVTAFKGSKRRGIDKDVESTEIWKDLFKKEGIDAKIVDDSETNGLQDGRIFYFDDSKNWWSRSGGLDSMPEGEIGGPDSEIFWDFGEEKGLHDKSEFSCQPCHVNCDCGRFVEIGNNVFIEYINDKSGFKALPNKNVDFGGGLERVAMAANDDPDAFHLDVFSQAMEIVERMSGWNYRENKEVEHAFRIILDHLRASTFLISDNAIPSNKDQGYFVRRLVRRSVRTMKQMGISELGALSKIAASFIAEYKESYPELKSKEKFILAELEKEEQKFLKTLAQGEKEYSKMIRISGNLSADDAFKLYATYGFPLELTIEMAAEDGIQINVEEYKKEFVKHQQISRAGAKKKFSGGLADTSEESMKLHTATHLLQQALRNVLGEHVEQKGSNITPERLRFDFLHPEKMTDEQKEEVERSVNEWIKMDLRIEMQMMTVQEARLKGAIGLFEEKYKEIGEKVKVYLVKDGDNVVSCEVCGGPHVDSIGGLGKFKIKKESSASAGIRRIKAILT
jgi:alanyl-tRNA synthetase